MHKFDHKQAKSNSFDHFKVAHKLDTERKKKNRQKLFFCFRSDDILSNTFAVVELI